MDSLSSSGADNQINMEHEDEFETGQNEEEGDLGPTWIPLEMESIVEKILGYLDLKSLKSARQVNKLWNCEGIKIMFKNFFIGVFPNFHLNKEKQKEEFETFLSYNSFKIPHLSIQHEKDVDVLKYIKTFEENVKETKSLRWTLDEKSKDVLKELLHKFSNLNYLDVRRFIPRGLKEIIMNFCTDTKTRLKQEQKNKKPLVISNFVLSAETDDLDFFGDLEKFTKCEGVMIKNLSVIYLSGLDSRPHLQNQFIKMINNILHSSQKVLTELILRSCERYLSQLHFPTMPNLTETVWAFHGQQHPGLNLYYGLHPSFKFAEMTPNLKKFELCWLGNPNERQEIDLWTNSFKSSGPAPSVKKLNYGDSRAGYNIEKLLQVFPNLQEFIHMGVGNFESVATSIWKFGLNIKRLNLRIRLSEDVAEFSSFDRIFTGFSQETVDLIQNSEDRVVSDVENLRVNPSILDLKGLGTCVFVFDHDVIRSPVPERILEVAGDYAFKLMPNVNITIGFRGYGAGSAAIRAASEKVSQLPNVNVDY